MTSYKMFNNSLCENVSLDLSQTSIRLTPYQHLRVVIAALLCLVAMFVVGFHCILTAAVVHQRYYKGHWATFYHSNVSNHKVVMLVSISLHHLILCGFCLPLTIFQIVNNSRWSLGYALCTARTFVESLVEMVNVYHMMYTCIDAYILVCHPLKYRLLPGKFGYIMAFFSWTIPVATTAFALSSQWHIDGIEEIIQCLQSHNLCIALYSKRYLLLMTPTTVLICVPTLVSVSVIVLKEIHRFHQRKYNKKNKTKDAITLQVNNKTAIKTSHLKSHVAKFCQNVQEPVNNLSGKTDVHNETYCHAISFSSPIEQASIHIVSMEKDTEESNYFVKDKTSLEEIAARKKIFQMSRKWKAFHKIGFIAVWHCFYWLSFTVFFVLLQSETKMFPLWTVSLVTSIRYLNSAINTAILSRHKTVRFLLKSFLCKI